MGEEVQNTKKRLAMHIYVLPNLVTTGNLFFGFFAIIQAIKGQFWIVLKHARNQLAKNE